MGTIEQGLTCWRTVVKPHSTSFLCLLLYLATYSYDQLLLHDVSAATEHYSPFTVFVYIDSDWVMDIHHCHSITVIITKLAGAAAIAWKFCVQPTVSLSSTEAEFVAARKMTLYLCFILDELCVT